MLIKNIVCTVDSDIFSAWKNINENGKGIIFVVDYSNKIKGLLTDGDIRRYLLNGGNLKTNVIDILSSDFVFAFENEDPTQILRRFNDRIKIIPLVNNNYELVDFLEYKSNIYLPVMEPDLLGNELLYLVDAFLSTWISSKGEYIDRFENNFADFCGTQYGIAVSNGTSALLLAMKALGIGAGDEVIVPDLTFAATINSVLHSNATPVIVDIEKEGWGIDPEQIKKAITSRTKAIIPVHLYGQPCEMESIMDIAKKNNLYVIEDCAEAHGAKYNDQPVGSFGIISCFSFFGNKIITTGEGGMCLTNDLNLANKMKLLRDHGMSKSNKYYHEVVGYNFRMTNIQAAIGVAQLERVGEILTKRKKVEDLYRELLSGVKSLRFQKNNLHKRSKVTWLVSALINNRNDIIDKLKLSNIESRPFFIPLSKMDIYKKYALQCSQSKIISDEGINFPTQNNLSNSTIIQIKNILEKMQN